MYVCILKIVVTNSVETLNQVTTADLDDPVTQIKAAVTLWGEGGRYSRVDGAFTTPLQSGHSLQACLPPCL